MREIKFRAWDKDEKKMRIFHVDNAIETGWHYHYLLEDESVKLQQYTGLKDKNGKEIYEGDIVEYKENWLESESGIDERFIHEVSWEVESFVLKNHGLLSELRDLKNKIKVIGNIYENKDLLK